MLPGEVLHDGEWGGEAGIGTEDANDVTLQMGVS